MPQHGSGPSFIDRDRIDAILRALVPDDAERDFVLRCVLREGPSHHRGANYVLLAMLGELLEALGSVAAPFADADTAPVVMRVPPHLAKHAPKHYPLGIPRAPLLALAGGGERKAREMAEALSDGPPQHALANAAMVALLARALEAARDRSAAS
jgi:hypothetical protein